MLAKTHGLLGQPKDRGLEEAGIRNLMAEEDWPVWIEEDVLHWFSHVERMENDRIAKRLYVGEFAGSSSAGQPRKEEVD